MTQAYAKPNIFTIPPSVSFSDTLAAGLLAEVGEEQHVLAQYLILLPTRRACRAVQDAFLRQSGGKPLMLPRLQPFGDIDAEELSLSMRAQDELDIPPALSPMRRQILLAQTISKIPAYKGTPDQNMALAQALGRLMDQIHTENLDIKDLPNLVDVQEISDHWNITVKFLEILSVAWPEVLAELGVIDAADRRNRLIEALNSHWKQNPPQRPVIAAGTTGSIPATAALLKTIMTLPQGRIILPGLDTHLTDKAWNYIEEGHPQATLKTLIEYLDVPRDKIKNWPYVPAQTLEMREKLLSHVMAPAEHTDEWQKIHLTPSQKKDITASLKQVTQYDCKTPQDEAQVIATILREALEVKNKTAALITPDRNLARRVAMICKRWNIELDDSGGQSLADSEVGTYLRLCAQAMIEGIKPVSLLAFLKHARNQGAGFKNFRSVTREMDKNILRERTAPAHRSGFKGVRAIYERKINDPNYPMPPSPNILDFIAHLEKNMDGALKIFSEKQDFSTFLKAHLSLAEVFATQDKSDNLSLWQGEEGDAAAQFLSDLQEHAALIPALSPQEYLQVMEQFMRSITIRPKYGRHPRLMILGQLEARLSQADCIILGGMNEGTWPPSPAHDPWMSRPMRQKFGLPVPERDITLAAHDFAQGFCSPEVYITRAERSEGTPTVPARWLQRLDTFLQAVEINPQIIKGDKHQKYAKILDGVEIVKPIERPKPIPDVESRPRKLSVTKIEKWLKDPYGLYAEKILRLRKIDMLEKQVDAAERGTILHALIEKFTDTYKKDIPDSAKDDFVIMAQEILENHDYDPATWSFWSPRMAKLAEWIIPQEQEWRQTYRFLKSEVKGNVILNENLQAPFILEARVDRIDQSYDGQCAIIDYKSGGAYSASKIQSGALPQLPLEALILSEGGFQNCGISQQNINTISYWVLTGGNPAGKILSVEGEENLKNVIETTKEGLTRLIQIFDDPQTPYYAIPRLDNAPSYNDYAYLERVKEWAALGENGEEAA